MKRSDNLNMPAFIKYLSALLLFGLNGIVAGHISLNSYEIVFLRTLIGSILLICIFMFGKGKFHLKGHKRDVICIVLSGIAMGTSWMFLYEAYQKIGVSYASLMYYCGPVIVMILSPLLFKEKLSFQKKNRFPNCYSRNHVGEWKYGSRKSKQMGSSLRYDVSSHVFFHGCVK